MLPELGPGVVGDPRPQAHRARNRPERLGWRRHGVLGADHVVAGAVLGQVGGRVASTASGMRVRALRPIAAAYVRRPVARSTAIRPSSPRRPVSTRPPPTTRPGYESTGAMPGMDDGAVGRDPRDRLGALVARTVGVVAGRDHKAVIARGQRVDRHWVRRQRRAGRQVEDGQDGQPSRGIVSAEYDAARRQAGRDPGRCHADTRPAPDRRDADAACARAERARPRDAVVGHRQLWRHDVLLVERHVKRAPQERRRRAAADRSADDRLTDLVIGGVLVSLGVGREPELGCDHPRRRRDREAGDGVKHAIDGGWIDRRQSRRAAAGVDSLDDQRRARARDVAHRDDVPATRCRGEVSVGQRRDDGRGLGAGRRPRRETRHPTTSADRVSHHGVSNAGGRAVTIGRRP